MDIDLVFNSISSDTATNAKPSTKFQPKSKPKPKPKPKPQTQPEPEPEPKSIPNPSTEFVESVVTENNEQISRTEDEEPKNDENLVSTTETGTSTDGNVENGPTESGLINNIDACTNLDPIIDNEDFQTQNLSAGPKVSKFIPKPKGRTRKMEEIYNNTLHEDEHEDNNNSCQINMINEVIGSSSIKPTDSIPTEPISEESTEIVDSGGKSSKRLRKKSQKALQLIDENIDFENGEEHSNNDGDNVPDNEILIVKKGNKSKKTVNEKEKPIKKRKMDNEVQTEPPKVVKKKFPHSTRRPKRQVDPELLKIPEDEFELHMNNVPIKEVIRLAEYRERLAKKEASTSAVNQSSSGVSNHNNDEYSGIENSENDNAMEAQNTTFYNYRTFMKTKPRMKWSKQDTELFYEAVQQFGTDLSMIKECFPGRTREQIKSKYKKEERQQPLRLNDALTTRAKGISHFEVVIERLKQAQGEEDYDEDGSPTHDLNEAVDAMEKEELKDDIPVVKSPIKSDDSEDDDVLPWDQYNSEI